MSSAALSRSDLAADLSRHLAHTLGYDQSDREAMDGIRAIASAVLDYFSAGFSGLDSSAGNAALWALCSALWEGRVNQQATDTFFQSVNIDPLRLLTAWQQMDASERVGPMTVALIPGRLDEIDIRDVVAALYKNRMEQKG